MVAEIDCIIAALADETTNLYLNELLRYEKELIASRRKFALVKLLDAALCQCKVIISRQALEANPQKWTIDSNHQSILNIFYQLCVCVLRSVRDISAQSRVPDDDIPKYLQKFVILLRAVRSVCPINALVFRVIGDRRLSECEEMLEEVSARDKKALQTSRTANLIFTMLIHSLRIFLNAYREQSKTFIEEIAQELFYVIGVDCNAHAIRNSFDHSLEHALAIILQFQRFEASRFCPKVLKSLSELFINEKLPVSVRLMAMEAMLLDCEFRQMLAAQMNPENRPEYLILLQKSASWKFVDNLKHVTQKLPMSEISEYILTQAMQSIDRLTSEKPQSALTVLLSSWSYGTQTCGKSLLTFTECAAAITGTNLHVEVPYGRIKSIRISNGGVLSFRLVSDPTVFHRSWHTSDADFDALEYGTLVNTKDDTLSLHISKDGISRLKETDFKKWVQREQQVQAAFKKEYQNTQAIRAECFARLPARELPLFTRRTIPDDSSPIPQPGVHEQNDISPLQQPCEIYQFIASCTMASPIDQTPRGSSLLIDSIPSPASLTTLGSGVVSPVNYASIDSPSALSKEAISPPQANFDFEEENSPDAKRYKGNNTMESVNIKPNEKLEIRNPFDKAQRANQSTGLEESTTKQYFPMQSRSLSKPIVTETGRTIDELLGQIHQAIGARIQAKKVEGEELIAHSMQTIKDRLLSVRKRIDSNQLGFEQSVKERLSKAKERSDRLRNAMRATIHKLNAEMSAIDNSMQKVDRTIADTEMQLSRSAATMHKEAQTAFGAFDNEMQKCAEELQKQVGAFAEENDPAALFAEYVTKKGKWFSGK